MSRSLDEFFVIRKIGLPEKKHARPYSYPIPPFSPTSASAVAAAAVTAAGVPPPPPAAALPPNVGEAYRRKRLAGRDADNSGV